MFLLRCVIVWTIASLTGRVAGDWTGDDGEKSYQFIYHKDYQLLLTIHGDGCYYASMGSGLHGDVFSDFRLTLEDQVKSIISKNGVNPRKQSTTIDQVRDRYHDLLADYHCLAKDIYTMELDYVNCDFEHGLCGWAPDRQAELQWRLRKGETPTTLTGPDNDHTLGNSQGQYVYLEANNARPGTLAELVSPTVDVSREGLCLRFWYNMHGNDMGTLLVYARDAVDPTINSTWSLSGDQGRGWKVAELTVSPASKLQLHMRAVRGGNADSDLQADIAVDDVSSTPGVCTPTLLDCSFESDLCHWTQVGAADGMDWIIKKGDTQTGGTGPHSTPNQGAGNLNYLYMEGDNGNPGATADVQSPIIQPQGPLCLQFWYFMKGTGVGELDILILDRNTMTEKVIWARTSEQGDTWEKAEVTVTSPDPATPVQVLIRAVRGTSVVSDIAIDLVRGLSGTCEQYARMPIG